MLLRWIPRIGLALTLACAGSEPADPGGPADAAALDAGALADAAGLDAGALADGSAPSDAGRPPATDPFAPQPDTSEGLTNVSADLEALLERGTLEGACAAAEADPTDRRKMLLCGKSMFFYEGFGTVGVPAAIVDFIPEHLPAIVGEAWSSYGLVPDPYSASGRPLGFGPGAPIGDADSVAFTCASCHFGRLPDGRYAVGAPNQDYDYGGHILAIALAPSLLRPGADESAHHPDAIAKVRPILDAFAADRRLRIRFTLELLPLLGAETPQMSRDQEGHYARWLPGTMDFVIAPLPLDDGVHTVSKINPLWGIPTPDERDDAGMPHAMLGWTGNATSVMGFLRGFVTLGGGPVDAWTEERLRPLEAYIHSLRAPDHPDPPAPDAVTRGEALFADRGCLDCHQGPRGSGLEVYSFDEIGTDREMEKWMDPELDGAPCCGVQLQPDEALTRGVKSPRLVGLWAQQRFLHNGAVNTLEALFCLDGARPTQTDPAYGDQGHDFTCDGLTELERRDLIAYLLSH